MSDHRYRLTYRLDSHDPGITKEEARERWREGACDAMLMASIIYPADGSYSCLFLSKDGRTGDDLPDIEWFKVWVMLSKRLMESKTLDAGRKALAQYAWEACREAIFGRKPAGG